MKFVECPKCNKVVEPSRGHRCPDCHTFLHPDPLKRLEADMAAKLRRWIIEELPKLERVLPSDFTLDPEKLETLSYDELTETIFRVIEPEPSGSTSHGLTNIFKVPVIGDEESGKSAYLYNSAQGSFTDTYKMTIGTAFITKTLPVKIKSGGRCVFRLQLWDISAKPHHAGVRPLFYQGSSGALLFFNRGEYSTFKQMDYWFREVDQNAGNIPRILVGFFDARKQENDALEVTRREAKELALDYKIPYFEVTLQDKPDKNDNLQHLDAPYLKLVDMILEKKGWFQS